MRRAVFYLRVSTIDQTTASQERELRDIARRMGCEVVKVYKDHGISGAKGRNGRPAFVASLGCTYGVAALAASILVIVSSFSFLYCCTRNSSGVMPLAAIAAALAPVALLGVPFFRPPRRSPRERSSSGHLAIPCFFGLFSAST